MLKKKNILKVLMIAIFSLGLISCESETKEKTKTVAETTKVKNITIGENLELYNGIAIKKISLLTEKDKTKIEIEFEAKNIEELKEYYLAIHAYPLKNPEEKFQNWDLNLKNIIEKNGKYYISRYIDMKDKEYKLNTGLFKVEKTEDGVIKYPGFGNTLSLELKL